MTFSSTTVPLSNGWTTHNVLITRPLWSGSRESKTLFPSFWWFWKRFEIECQHIVSECICTRGSHDVINVIFNFQIILSLMLLICFILQKKNFLTIVCTGEFPRVVKIEIIFHYFALNLWKLKSNWLLRLGAHYCHLHLEKVVPGIQRWPILSTCIYQPEEALKFMLLYIKKSITWTDTG